MCKKIIIIIVIILFIICGLDGIESKEMPAEMHVFTHDTMNMLDNKSVFLLFNEFGGTFHDTEKNPDNDDDDWLCWAAASANVLAWTGWGTKAYSSDADRIFTYFQECWNDNSSGSGFRSWYWWFKGIDVNNGGSSYLEKEGGGFFPEIDFPDDAWGYEKKSVYRGVGKNYLRKRPMKLADLLRDGYGVVLQIVKDSDDGDRDSHIITLWGYSYSEDNQFSGIFITDSDDSKKATNPGDWLVFYPLTYLNSKYYFNTYGDESGWYILAGYGLAKRSVFEEY
ncbi:MAG: IdeS/Mac family cysteine endopeptidase [Spirochaetales bacterium]|nr:IdeS/Mac family cysteine endopeptidase [Spirochaetales bacterium]